MVGKPLRAAVIGCGLIGSKRADDPLLAGDVFTHAEAYVRSGATELVAVCDVDPQSAGEAAKRWGIDRSFTNAAAMVADAEPDLVSICTPTDDHYASAKAVLEGAPGVRAILCEKPLAPSIEKAEELVQLAKQRNVLLGVVYMRRYARNFQELARFIKSGELGETQAVSGWYAFGTLHSGTHWFDMVRMLVGEVEWVSAENHLQENGPDPTLDVTLGLAGGTVATLRALAVRHFMLFEMDVVGTEGRVRITDNGFRMELFRPGPSQRTSGLTDLHTVAHEFGDRRNLMLNAVEDIVRALQEGATPAANAESGLAALRIGHCALRSAAQGGRIVRLGC